jgi:hypothetical protein
MAVLLKTVSLFCYAPVSSVVDVLDRIPMEYFVTNTCPPPLSKWLVGEVDIFFFLTVGYANLGRLFLL